MFNMYGLQDLDHQRRANLGLALLSPINPLFLQNIYFPAVLQNRVSNFFYMHRGVNWTDKSAYAME